MADFVNITNTGIIPYEWDSDSKEYIPIKVDSYISLLRCRCEISPGTTLGDIFKAVGSNIELASFFAKYSWCTAIEEFHDQAKLPPNPIYDPTETLTELHIEAFAEIKEKLEDEELDEFDFMIDFSGVIVGENQAYSVSYTPMNDIAHLPVKLIETCTCRKGNEITSVTSYSYTLLEVLDAIYYDISFMGGPEDNKKFIQQTIEIVDDIKSGNYELRSWDEL